MMKFLLRSVMLLLLLLPTSALQLSKGLMGRRSAVLSVCTAATLGTVAEARADPKKYDDECISKCCSKLQNINKGIGKVEYVSRVEAIAQCKPGCVIGTKKK